MRFEIKEVKSIVIYTKDGEKIGEIKGMDDVDGCILGVDCSSDNDKSTCTHHKI